MKLTTLTHVTIYGVMQGLGGSNEDRRGGFERGGRRAPFTNVVADLLGGAPGVDDPRKARAQTLGQNVERLVQVPARKNVNLHHLGLLRAAPSAPIGLRPGPDDRDPSRV